MKANDFLVPLADTAGVKAEEFYTLIKKENKEGKYSIVPFKLNFNGGTIQHNAGEVLKLSEMARNWADEVVAHGTLQQLKDGQELLTVLHRWMSSTRKSLTASLDATKKELMQPEKLLQEAKDTVRNGIETMQELEYRKVQEALEAYLLELQEELEKEDIKLDLLSIFADFIARKRKTQALTEKGVVKKRLKMRYNQNCKRLYLKSKKKEPKRQRLKSFVNME